MEVEFFSEEELCNTVESLKTLTDKQEMQQAFLQIHAALKKKMEFFNPRGPLHHLVIKIIDLINSYFIKFESSFEFYKGLVFISNIILYLDKSYSEHFLLKNPLLLIQLSNCFMQIKTNQKENDFMFKYTLLALIAQLLHQTNKSENESIKEIRETIVSKKFLLKIFEFDVEE